MMLGLGNLFVNLSCRARSWGVPRKRHSASVRSSSPSFEFGSRDSAQKRATITYTYRSNFGIKYKMATIQSRGAWPLVATKTGRTTRRDAHGKQRTMAPAHNGSESRHEEDWEEEEKSEIIVIRKSRIHRRSLLQNPARCADSTVGHTFSSFQEDFPRWGL